MNKSLFLKTFGDYPALRVIDFFLENKIFDYSKSDIARNVKISRVTLDEILKDLEKAEVLIKTRKMGKSVLFALNERSPIVKKLEELDMAISESYANKLEEEQKIKVRA